MLLATLRRNGFWIDELYTLHSIRLGWKDMVLERLHRGHFPGYFALVRLWYSFWPEQMFELALRSMSVVFYLLAVASFWPLARRVLSSPQSLVALALFACNGVALRQAGEARMYTVTLFIAVWITRAWLELQLLEPFAENAARRLRWSIALVALPVLGFVVSPTTGVLIGSMLAVGLLWRRAEVWPLNRKLALALVLSLLVFIPGAIFHVSTADRLGISSSKPAVFLGHIVALMPGVQLWDDYYQKDDRARVLLALGAIVTITAISILWRRRRDLPRWMQRSALVVALPLVAITLSYPLVELFALDIMGPPRYFLTLMPLAALLGAWALMQFRRRILVHGALTVLLLASAWVILTVRVEQFRQRLLEYLQPRFKSGDGLVVTAHEIADGVELYVPGTRVDVPVNRWEMDKAALASQLAPLGSKETVWLVWYRGNASPVIEVAESLWGSFISNRPEKPYGALRVYEFHPAQKAAAQAAQPPPQMP
jgi:hypothetical protein